jgi:hypothetical protein
MDIGPEGEPIEVPIPVHPDQVPIAVPAAPDPERAVPEKVPT